MLKEVIPTRLISCDWFSQLARAYMASATMAPREMERVYRTHAHLVSMETTVTNEIFHVLMLRLAAGVTCLPRVSGKEMLTGKYWGHCFVVTWF